MIYDWFNPNLDYASYLGKEEQDETAMCWDSPVLGESLPMLSEWRTPVLTQYIGNNREKSSKIISDCVSSGSMRLVNQKSIDALADIWDKHATLYPVILDDKPEEPYYMVVVHTLIDCIDREKSVGKIQKFGKHKDKGYFSNIHQWVFRENEIGDNFMFVLPDSPTTIYLTESFKRRIIEAGLTGFGFVKQAYDDTPFVS